MLLQQNNTHTENATQSNGRIPASAEQIVLAGVSNLALSIGAHLDPGIRRSYKPNEDTVLVTSGFMPSTRSATHASSFSV